MLKTKATKSRKILEQIYDIIYSSGQPACEREKILSGLCSSLVRIVREEFRKFNKGLEHNKQITGFSVGYNYELDIIKIALYNNIHGEITPEEKKYYLEKLTEFKERYPVPVDILIEVHKEYFDSAGNKSYHSENKSSIENISMDPA